MYTQEDQVASTEAFVAAAASIAAAAIGVIAGPAGVIAGALIGSVVGAGAGAMLADSSARRWHHDEELDKDIGVFDGRLGEAPPDAPAAEIGAFSTGSVGSAGATPSVPPPSEGPMQDLGT